MRRSYLHIGLVLSAALAMSCEDGTKTDDTGTSLHTGETGYPDADGDGYDSLEDCDDTDATVNPGAIEDCNGIDDDCDGEIDEDVADTFFADGDNDGFGSDDDYTEACEAVTGYVPVGGDCDDEDPSTYPGAEEICDGIDNDCDDEIDNDLDTGTYYRDSDGDGYGDGDEAADACDQPSGYVDNADDCDDDNSMEPVHVSSDGSSSGTGTADDPLDAIQSGIDAADTCVFVESGTYTENIDFGGNDISVIGGGTSYNDGSDDTTIDGSDGGSTVTFDDGESEDAVLSGFVITGGSGTMEESSEDVDCGSVSSSSQTTYRYYGGGIYVSSSTPTLENLQVTENSLTAYDYSEEDSDDGCGDTTYTYSYGGGIFLGNTTMDIADVTIDNNSADNGGGVYINSDSVVDMSQSKVGSNSASSGGGVTSAGTTALTNVLLDENSADNSGGGMGGGGVDVIGGDTSLNNVTAVGNSSSYGSVYLSNAAEATVWNSIVNDNDDGYMIDGDVGTTLNVSYSDVYGGSSGEYGSAFSDPTGSDGNISEDPMFTDSSGGDYSLDPSSPCVDAGEGDDGDGSDADMGAWGGEGSDW